MCMFAVGLSVVALGCSIVFNSFLWHDNDNFQSAPHPMEYTGKFGHHTANWFLWAGIALVLAFLGNSRSIPVGLVLSGMLFAWFRVLVNWESFQGRTNWASRWETTWVGVFGAIVALGSILFLIAKGGIGVVCTV